MYLCVIRYPILGRVPPGGSPPTYPFVNAAAYIAFGCALSSSRAYLFLSVARVLFLLHCPRFPFHDSTGFITISPGGTGRGRSR